MSSINTNGIINSGITRRGFLKLLGVSGVALGLTACGGSGQAAASGDAATTSNVTKITIGTEGTYAPYTYLDDNNNLTGFDVELARAIDDKLPDYEFEFQTIEWSSMFASLDAGKIQTIANEVAANDARKQKYLFEDTPFAYSVNAIAFKKGRTDIKGITDLYGKVVDGGTTATNTTWLENYNAEHDNPITINYTDGDISKTLQDILNGRADATISSPVTLKTVVEEQGLDIDWVIFPDSGTTPVYFPFPNTDDGAKLRDAFEGAIKELLADGTIADLSTKFLGADYSTEESVQKLAAEQQAK